MQTLTCSPRSETFKAARERIFAELEALGWTVTRGLKVPYATAPTRRRDRVWFKPQALYAGGDNLNNSRSICSDYRGVRGADIEKAVLK